MERKTARLTLLIDPNKKAAFEHLCSLQDRTASQVVRQLIRDYLVEHGTNYNASDADGSDGGFAAGAAPRAAEQPMRKAKPVLKAGSGRRRS